MDRRRFLAATAVASAASTLTLPMAAALPHPAKTAKTSKTPFQPIAPTLNRQGIDRDRAAFIMQQAGLDAIILGRAENAYYATGNWPMMARLGLTDASFAIIPADPAAPIAMICPQFSYYYTATETGYFGNVEPFLVTGQIDDAIADPFIFTNAATDKLTKREQRRRSQTAANAPYFGSHAAALTKALSGFGAITGAVGYDSGDAQALLANAAPLARGRDASDIIKHLRLIKTADEIAYMTTASAANVAAAYHTARQMRTLGTIKNVRNHFNATAAQMGNSPRFMVVNGAIDEAYDEDLHEGTSVLIDCVSAYGHYHGDFGRSIFIGEPLDPIATKVKQMTAAWDALRQQLKPGLRFSDIRAQGAALLKKMGADITVPFNPHGVGLAHTEHPQFDLAGAPYDVALEAGMIISVDCPLMETSQQGTAHLEDLTLITENGFKPIHAINSELVII